MRPNSYERQKMKGLIYRDITLLKLYLKWPVLIFSMIAFVAMFIKRFESLSMVAMLPAIFVYATSLIFDDDDKFNWEKYLRTLPVSPVKVVWSRTVVFSGFVALGTAISFAISMISFVFFREQPFAEYLKIPFAGLLIGAIMIVLIYPICQAVGSPGAGIAFLLLWGMLSVSMYLSYEKFGSLGAFVSANAVVFWCSAAAVLTFLPIISFYLSVFFFKRRKIH